MLMYFSRDNVALCTAKKPFTERAHFAQFSDEATQTQDSFPKTVNFNERLSYSEIYMEISANSAIMLQAKLEAN